MGRRRTKCCAKADLSIADVFKVVFQFDYLAKVFVPKGEIASKEAKRKVANEQAAKAAANAIELQTELADLTDAKVTKDSNVNEQAEPITNHEIKSLEAGAMALADEEAMSKVANEQAAATATAKEASRKVSDKQASAKAATKEANRKVADEQAAAKEARRKVAKEQAAAKAAAKATFKAAAKARKEAKCKIANEQAPVKAAAKAAKAATKAAANAAARISEEAKRKIANEQAAASAAAKISEEAKRKVTDKQAEFLGLATAMFVLVALAASSLDQPLALQGDSLLQASFGSIVHFLGMPMDLAVLNPIFRVLGMILAIPLGFAVIGRHHATGATKLTPTKNTCALAAFFLIASVSATGITEGVTGQLEGDVKYASSPVQLPNEIVPSDSFRVHTATIQKLKMALKEQQKKHETELKKQSMKHMVAMQKCERKKRFSKNRFSGVQVSVGETATSSKYDILMPRTNPTVSRGSQGPPSRVLMAASTETSTSSKDMLVPPTNPTINHSSQGAPSRVLMAGSAEEPKADLVCTESCTCPEGQICDVETSQPGGTYKGLFRHFVCKGKNACNRIQGADNGPVKAASVVCDGESACQRAKGFTLSGDIQCKGHEVCTNLGPVKAASAVCEGRGTCQRAKGFTLSGAFQCKGYDSCKYLGPVKAASAVCDGADTNGNTCFRAEGFTLSGAFQCKGDSGCNYMGPVKAASAVCDGKNACSYAKGFTLSGDIQCKGPSNACNWMEPVKAARAVCDGKDACSHAKGFTLSGAFQCKGFEYACKKLGPVKAASAVCDGKDACSYAKGFTLTESMTFLNKNGNPRAIKPSGTSFAYNAGAGAKALVDYGGVDNDFYSVGGKLQAIAFFGFRNPKNSGFAGWPLEAACKDSQDATDKWYYCLGSKTCKDEAAKCGGIPTQRADRAVEVHNPLNLTGYVSAVTNMKIEELGRKKKYGYVAFGKVQSMDVEIKAMSDFGAGHQGFSAKRTGGVRSIAGTVTNVDLQNTDLLVNLPEAFYPNTEAFRPNHDSTFLAPVVSEDQQGTEIKSALVNVMHSGKLKLSKLSTGDTDSSGLTFSFGHIHFVPKEVKNDLFNLTTADSPWSVVEGLTAYYHKLDMGDNNRLCVLSGSITTNWTGGGSEKVIGPLSEECTRGYEGFWVPANIKLGGKQQSVDGSAAFQLRLTEDKPPQLALWAKAPIKDGTDVTVSVDGVTLASGGLPAICESNKLGEDLHLGWRVQQKALQCQARSKIRTWEKCRVNVDLGASPDDATARAAFDKVQATVQSEVDSVKKDVGTEKKKAATCKEQVLTETKKAQSCTQKLNTLKAAISESVSHGGNRSSLGEVHADQSVGNATGMSTITDSIANLSRELHETARSKMEAAKDELLAAMKETESCKDELLVEEKKISACMLELEKLKPCGTDASSKGGHAAGNLTTAAIPASTPELTPEPTPTLALAPSSALQGCKQIHDKVDYEQPGFPTKSVLDASKMVASGNTIQTRMCTLKGVIKFTAINESAQAQIDPNLRDPSSMTPLCFPIATMTFFAGVVADDKATSPIQSNVILQVEPHGRIRIIGQKINADTFVRLDGITYAPFMQFNEPPPQCAPYCFPLGEAGGEMTSTGCIKYCTPPAYKRNAAGELQPLECQCDMMKRLECWKHEGSTSLRCGQFKQLLRMYKISSPNDEVGDADCGKTCGEQLSGL